MRWMDGAVILDKPAGITSFAAVRKVRGLLGGAKVGHVGTLDPLGTGVLPMLVGRATRLAQFYLGHKREYVAGIRFGWATDTYDQDGEPLGDPVEASIDASDVEGLLEGFRGVISQVPPPVSAKKIDGVRAYKLARSEAPVEPDPVEVEIYDLELVDVSESTATIRCFCSTGTYIRSLAHAIGQLMGCGAHVASLRRTRVGEFSLEDARTIEDLQGLSESGTLDRAVLSPLDLLPEIPVHRVGRDEAALIRHGRDFRVSPFGKCRDARFIKAVTADGQLVCLGQAVIPRVFHPFVVFN